MSSIVEAIADLVRRVSKLEKEAARRKSYDIPRVTSWSTWTPAHTGFSTDPTVITAAYRIVGETCEWIYVPFTAGTSNASTYTISLPLPATTGSWRGHGRVMDIGTVQADPGLWSISAGTIMTFYKNLAAAGFGTSGGKYFQAQGSYDIG